MIDPTPSNDRKKALAAAFIVSLLTTLVYLPSLQNAFVNWDDDLYIYENPYVRSMDAGFFKWIFTSFYAANWYPLTWLSHAADYAVWGLDPAGHHLTSILLHGLNTFLVVMLVTLLVNYARRRDPAGHPLDISLAAGILTGLLFGLHPLRVESVAWVSERKDLLCAFFFLLSILSYLRYTSPSFSSPLARVGQKGVNYTLCLLFFAMALMSKPMAVTLPVVLLILDIYPLERTGSGSYRRVITEKLPFFVLSILSSALTITAQRSGSAVRSLENYPFGDRVVVAFRALCFYLGKMLRPSGLAPLYPYPHEVSFWGPQNLGALAVVALITVFCVRSWKRHKVFAAVWAYYLVTLLPVLGIIQVGSQAAADRYTYLPGLGPSLLAGLGLALFAGKFAVVENPAVRKKRLAVLALAAAVIVSLLSVLTIRQSENWKDSFSLCNRELELFPDSVFAYTNRGAAFMDSGRYREASEDFMKAIELDPRSHRAYYNLGIMYSYKLNNYYAAIEYFKRALELEPGLEKAHFNLGLIYETRLDDYHSAIRYYGRAVELKPDFAEAYNNRGLVYLTLKEYDKALKDFNASIDLNSKDPLAYFNRGLAYDRLSSPDQADKDFRESARLGYKRALEYIR